MNYCVAAFYLCFHDICGWQCNTFHIHTTTTLICTAANFRFCHLFWLNPNLSISWEANSHSASQLFAFNGTHKWTEAHTLKTPFLIEFLLSCELIDWSCSSGFLSCAIFVFLDPPILVDKSGLLHLGFQTKQSYMHLSSPHSKIQVIRHINITPHNFLI